MYQDQRPHKNHGHPEHSGHPEHFRDLKPGDMFEINDSQFMRARDHGLGLRRLYVKLDVTTVVLHGEHTKTCNARDQHGTHFHLIDDDTLVTKIHC